MHPPCLLRVGQPRRAASALAVAALVLAAACSGIAPGGATPMGPIVSPGQTVSPLDRALFATTYAPKVPASTAPTGTLVIGGILWSLPATFNLWYSPNALYLMQPAMRGLVAITSDGKFIPDLATTVPTPENGGVVVNGLTFDVKVTLKPDLKWSDGTPLTMDDYVATWEWATDPHQTGCSPCAVGWPDIGGIDESSDKLTATIHFKDLYAGWLGFLTNGPWPAKYLDSVPVPEASTLYPASSAMAKVPVDGPFVIANVSQTEIDYAPNPYWAGGVSTVHPPYLAGLKFVDAEDEWDDFLNGRLDLALGMTQAQFLYIAGVVPSIGRAEEVPSWQYEHLDINNDPNHTRGNDLWDPAVRKALAMAIDKQDMISALFPRQSIQPACSPAPPGLWYGVPETCPGYDPAAAIGMLQAAGWALGPDGFFTFQGKTIDLEMCTTEDDTRQAELYQVQRYLAGVHVRSHIELVDGGSILFAPWGKTTPTTDCSIYRGTYDLADFAWAPSGDPYNDYFYIYASTQWPELGDHSGSNDTRFSDPNMDAALTTLRYAVDPGTQAVAAKAVQDVYVAGTPEIPLYYRAAVAGVGAHLGNWPGYSPAAFGPFWNVEDWYYLP